MYAALHKSHPSPSVMYMYVPVSCQAISQAPLWCQLLIPMHTMPLQPMIYKEVSLFTYIPSAKEIYCIVKESNIIGRVTALQSSSHVDWYMSVCSGVDGCEEQSVLCLTWWVLVDHVSSAPRPWVWLVPDHSLPPPPGQWSTPPTTGRTPPPSDGMTLIRVDRRRVVWFGGWDEERRRRTNAVFILDTVAWVSG